MGLVQHFATVLLLSAHLAHTYPAMGELRGDSVWCSPGEYLKSGAQCAPCAAGHFTAVRNREPSCFRCFGDCRADYHLTVAQNCTGTSNLKCVCRTGYTCEDKYDANICRYCAKEQETTTLAVSTGNNKQTTVASPEYGSSTAEPCQLPKCGPRTVPPPSNNTDAASSLLTAILTPVVLVGCVALVILLCVHRPGDETCFKQAIVKLYNEGGHEASHKSKEPTHQVPRDSFSAKQPSSLSTANLGPVHVHNPGTVIFSLLSQFTGQVGPTVEGKGTAEKVSSEEDDERSCPVFHPASSPSIHLSEEERSAEMESIFFPSQEQGKDCHVSKEEEL